MQKYFSNGQVKRAATAECVLLLFGLASPYSFASSVLYAMLTAFSIVVHFALADESKPVRYKQKHIAVPLLCFVSYSMLTGYFLLNAMPTLAVLSITSATLALTSYLLPQENN